MMQKVLPRPVVLVTGFTPFGGESINPSWEIAQAIDIPKKIARVERLLVSTEFGHAIKTVTRAIDQLQPDIVLCLGQAGGRSRLSVERVAINIDDANIADNAGAMPIDQPVVMRAPAAYFSNLPIKAMVAAIEAQHLPATVSNSAGTFVCNHLLYGVLHHLARRKLLTRAGFIHVPFLPSQVLGRANISSMSLADMLKGVEIAIMTAIQTKTDICQSGGALD
jgi:pyroglutamyl-peptidase